jgi:prophage tail gpP-like protein
MSNSAILRVGGQRLSGWLSVEVQGSLEALSAEVTLGVVLESTATLPPVVRGQELIFELGGQRAISGYVRAVKSRISGDDLSVTVTGRDYTADLVDCSAIHKSGAWTNTSLERIARDLCSPFKIDVVWSVSDATASQPFATFKLDHSETVFEALSRAARMRGIIMTRDTFGRVVFTEPGAGGTADALVLGDNLLECEYVDDDSDRFSVYQVLGDSAGGDLLGSSMTLEQVSTVATFVDAGVPRWRPKQLWSSTSTGKVKARNRAQAEQAKGLSQGQRVTAKVRGWQQTTGRLWEANQMAEITAKPLGLDTRAMLIVSFRLGLDDDGGEVATLTLAPKAGYDLPRDLDPAAQSAAIAGIGLTQAEFDKRIPPSHF